MLGHNYTMLLAADADSTAHIGCTNVIFPCTSPQSLWSFSDVPIPEEPVVGLDSVLFSSCGQVISYLSYDDYHDHITIIDDDYLVNVMIRLRLNLDNEHLSRHNISECGAFWTLAGALHILLWEPWYLQYSLKYNLFESNTTNYQ